jgi:hypothetical protein
VTTPLHMLHDASSEIRVRAFALDIAATTTLGSADPEHIIRTAKKYADYILTDQKETQQ